MTTKYGCSSYFLFALPDKFMTPIRLKLNEKKVMSAFFSHANFHCFKSFAHFAKYFIDESALCLLLLRGECYYTLVSCLLQ